MNECSAIILAGGKSSRMGEKKALLSLHGKPFIELIIEKLQSIGVTDIVLSGYEYSHEKVICVEDIYKNKGPLAGVHAGLKAIKGNSALVIAEDAPLFPEWFLRRLTECHRQGEWEITVSYCKGRLQPLAAVYDQSLYKNCEELLKAERASLMDLILGRHYREVAFDGNELLIRGCNTRDEYERLMKLPAETTGRCFTETDTISVKRINRAGEEEPGRSLCLKEHKLLLLINGSASYQMVCTDRNIRELVYGRLLTEGIIEKASDVKLFSVSADHTQADVTILNENMKTKSSKTYISHKADTERIFQLIDIFSEDRGIHRETGAAHKCILLCGVHDGKNEFFSLEDIGRYNAIDKALGYALLNHICLSECMLFTSGRVSEEMVRKVITAGIPILVSKSVPSVDAVRTAKAYGLNLICRAWPDSFEIYSE